MKSKISFYSFKDTEHPAVRPPRNQQESHFLQFQNIRLQQHQSIKKKQKQKKAISQSILVRSQQQKQLLSFLKLPNLPQIKLKQSRKIASSSDIIPNPQQKIKGNTPLEKILSNKKKFMRTYFNSLNKFEKEEGIEQIKHIYREIQIGAWKIKGYLKKEQLIIKAVNTSGRQRYLKYQLTKYGKQIKRNYQRFIKEKIMDQLQLYDT